MDAIIFGVAQTRNLNNDNKRCIKEEEGTKHQPERLLAHLRNVYHTESLARIERHIASTNEDIGSKDSKIS